MVDNPKVLAKSRTPKGQEHLWRRGLEVLLGCLQALLGQRLVGVKGESGLQYGDRILVAAQIDQRHPLAGQGVGALG